jgi:hypothetical protein
MHKLHRNFTLKYELSWRIVMGFSSESLLGWENPSAQGVRQRNARHSASHRKTTCIMPP